MQKFIIEENYFNNLTLPDDLIYQCVKVLRYKKGNTFLVCVNKINYLVEITDIKEKSLNYKIIEELNIDTELSVDVTIIQGYPKGDKFEDIIKYATQLGANTFIPLLAKRTQFKIDDKRASTKIARFNKIAKEASEQSMRNIIPEVTNFKKLSDIDFNSYNYVLVCYEETSKEQKHEGLKDIFKNLNKEDKIAILIGPEGGIDESEIAYLKKYSNTYLVSLGKRILRTELAPLTILSMLVYESELL